VTVSLKLKSPSIRLVVSVIYLVPAKLASNVEIVIIGYIREVDVPLESQSRLGIVTPSTVKLNV